MPFVRFLAVSVRTACVSVLSAAAREETVAATLCFSQLCERLLTAVRKIAHRRATVFAPLCDVFLTLVRILSHSRATTYSRLCDAKCRGESSLFRRSRCFFRAENSEHLGRAFFCATSANFVSRKANFVLQKAIFLPFLTIFFKRCDSTFLRLSERQTSPFCEVKPSTSAAIVDKSDLFVGTVCPRTRKVVSSRFLT